VHHEFLRQRQTVNRWYYLEVPKHLRENFRRKRQQLWTNNTWFLHHDNAPAHASLLIRDFLANTNTSCSPDLAPADFFLFPGLKSTLKGRRFQTIRLRKIRKRSYARSRKRRTRTLSRSSLSCRHVRRNYKKKFRNVLNRPRISVQ
jgi:hypothetical protein